MNFALPATTAAIPAQTAPNVSPAHPPGSEPLRLQCAPALMATMTMEAIKLVWPATTPAKPAQMAANVSPAT